MLNNSSSAIKPVSSFTLNIHDLFVYMNKQQILPKNRIYSYRVKRINNSQYTQAYNNTKNLELHTIFVTKLLDENIQHIHCSVTNKRQCTKASYPFSHKNKSGFIKSKNCN